MSKASLNTKRISLDVARLFKSTKLAAECDGRTTTCHSCSRTKNLSVPLSSVILSCKEA